MQEFELITKTLYINNYYLEYKGITQLENLYLMKSKNEGVQYKIVLLSGGIRNHSAH